MTGADRDGQTQRLGPVGRQMGSVLIWMAAPPIPPSHNGQSLLMKEE